MEQVSSFLENILAVEHDEDGKKKVDKKTNSLLIDKIVERLISIIIPVNNLDQQTIINERLQIQKTRPSLSMNIMSSNAIMLNSRLTNVFVFIDSVINFLNWTNPYLTVGILLIITHIILNPYLITILPIVLIINNVLVPHYLLVHPPDKSIIDHNPIPDDEALNDATLPGPVPQFSQEFLLNFTDLQNHMVLYICTYDFLIWLTKDYFYFKNEDLSSLVYLGLLALMGSNLFILPKLIPFVFSNLFLVKMIFIIMTWIFAIIIYPSNRDILLNFLYDENTRIGFLSRLNNLENKLVEKLVHEESFEKLCKIIEIYELQKFNRFLKSWEFIGFTNDFYSINNPLRKLNSNLFKDVEDEGLIEEEDNIKINRVANINNIICPKGWKFFGNWNIDLKPSEWVENNLIKDIVNIDDDEKWVYDFYDGDSEIFRRRRWTRYCVRDSNKKSNA